MKINNLNISLSCSTAAATACYVIQNKSSGQRGLAKLARVRKAVMRSMRIESSSATKKKQKKMSKSDSWLKVSCVCRLEILIYFFSFKATHIVCLVFSIPIECPIHFQLIFLLCCATTSTQTSLSVSFYMLNMQEAKFR